MLAWLLLAGLLDSERVALIALIEGGEDRLTLSSIQREVSRAASAFAGVQLFEAGEALSCGADVSCVAAALKQNGARHGLVALADLGQRPPLVLLRLIDAEGGRVAASISGTIEGADVHAAIRAHASRLLEEAGYLRRARLVVSTSPEGAIVTVDGTRAEGDIFLLAPGRHVVRAFGVERTIELAAGEDASIEVASPEASSILESPWLWIGVGAAVAGTISVFVLAGDDPPPRCVCFDVSCSNC